jgi:Helix-turn-helix domain
MAEKRPDTRVLTTRRQMAALASPVRLELVGAVKAAGPSSVRELAARMGRPADGLYHHVKALLRAGVLVQTDTRKAGKRTEAVYALAAPRIGGALDPASPAGRDDVTRAAAAVLRLAGREFTAAVRSGRVGCAGNVRNALVQRQKSWLTDDALAELHGLLARVEQLLTATAERRAGRPYAFTTVLAPLPPNRRASRADDAK